MKRLTLIAWVYFGKLLDLTGTSNSSASIWLDQAQQDLAQRRDDVMLAGDFRNVGNDMRTALRRFDEQI